MGEKTISKTKLGPNLKLTKIKAMDLLFGSECNFLSDVDISSTSTLPGLIIKGTDIVFCLYFGKLFLGNYGNQKSSISIVGFWSFGIKRKFKAKIVETLINERLADK